MRRSLALGPVLAAALLAPDSASQTCAGTTFWKNDALPNNPQGSLTISVIPGLCEGEAAGTVFQFPDGMAPQRLREVSVGFGHSSGGGGFTADVNVEIYLGPITFGPGSAVTLGPQVFDLATASGANVQVASTGLNVVDLTPYDVIVDRDFAVAFRMVDNPTGSCAAGHPANFFTDNTSAGGGGCPPGKNLLFELSQGWRDPTKMTILGFPLCPTFYAGNWVIRACTEDAPDTWVDLGGGTNGINGVPLLIGSGSLSTSSLIGLDLTFGPPSALGLLWLSVASTPVPAFGGTVHALPFVSQVLIGTDPGGNFSGQTVLPPAPPGVNLFFQCVLQDNTTIYGLTLSNAVRGTTQ